MSETASYPCFEVSIANQIAHIQLSRPEKRNCMSRSFWNDLPAIVKEIDHNAKARVIVISSTGPHFTAGLDLKDFGVDEGISLSDKETKDTQAAADFYSHVSLMQDSFSALEQCRIPVLAAIQGGCIGGGVDFTTACDIRYACEGAYFTIFEIKIAMTADVGTFPRIVKLLPEGIVRELAYTGRPLSAEEALSLGFVNKVFPDQESMLKGVMEIAKEIASNAPLAVYGCKKMINYARDHTTADCLDYVAVWNMSMLKPEEMMESQRAKMEKRPGNYVDLPVLKDRV
ncbi:MAG: enoyl-CoA hydratase [Gammaproteobacteria bacterium TMED133]|nr:MAG: enoyl-CoA hydratase [Gammaproteobacteria bacterium TMED133]